MELEDMAAITYCPMMCSPNSGGAFLELIRSTQHLLVGQTSYLLDVKQGALGAFRLSQEYVQLDWRDA